MNIKDKIIGGVVVGVALVAVLPIGCSSDVPACTVTCTADADCPGDQTCSTLGRCSDSGTCPCAAGAFLGCADGTTAQFCNSTGDGPELANCGGFACNATQERCDLCVPESVSCGDGGGTVERCDATGLPLASEACGVLGCVPGEEARCGRIVPVGLPEVCDTPAQVASVDLSGLLVTSMDDACTGGVVTQTGGPAVCVVRAGSIRVGDVKVTGARAIALVADGPLRVEGTLDASADVAASGPGGGTIVSGAVVSGARGGGGAGGRHTGASGGSTVAGGGGGGGAAIDPIVLGSIVGGARPSNGIMNMAPVSGGGGGGAVVLVSCRDTVTVSGLVDVGGGGGGGGRDRTAGAVVDFVAGGGGGAGGYLVLEGARVNVTGRLYANGGGGGGGCNVDDGVAPNGADGPRAQTGGPGSLGVGSGVGTGGTGGSAATPTVGGGSTDSAGGGGGAAGRFQIYVPSGVSPTLAPIEVSPAFEPHLAVPTR
ncbi:MAG: hypothetical protein KF773_20525 [Deltaproteobacteria bacterium]|nr:hypothetical protein [Deltaproteobacteria bacterium]